MKPTQELKHEHEAVELMLAILTNVVNKLEKGQLVDINHLRGIIDFLKTFVDKCHHTKEECLLFPALEAAGIPNRCGPIGVMLDEHETGRQYVNRMSKVVDVYTRGETELPRSFIEDARGYADLLTEHINKENNILYVMADDMLSEQAQNELLRGFKKIEEEKIGHGKHEEFHKLLHELSEIYTIAHA